MTDIPPGDLDAELRRNIAHLHVGPRALGELLAELGASRTVRTEIEILLRRHRRFGPEAVAAHGGRWWQ
jgi:hypothetical protein